MGCLMGSLGYRLSILPHNQGFVAFSSRPPLLQATGQKVTGTCVLSLWDLLLLVKSQLKIGQEEEPKCFPDEQSARSWCFKSDNRKFLAVPGKYIHPMVDGISGRKPADSDYKSEEPGQKRQVCKECKCENYEGFFLNKK